MKFLTLFIIFTGIAVFAVHQSAAVKARDFRGVNESGSGELDGSGVLIKTEQAYEAFTVYKSKGSAEYSAYGAGREAAKIKTDFDVVFEAPAKMTLNWRDSGAEAGNVFCLDGADSIWLQADKRTREFSDPVTALFAVSFNEHTSLFDVPNMLVIRKNLLTKKLTGVARLEDETEGGADCFKVRGEIKAVATDGRAVFTYWIDKKTFLIRRIDRQLFLADGQPPASARSEKYFGIEVESE